MCATDETGSTRRGVRCRRRAAHRIQWTSGDIYRRRRIVFVGQSGVNVVAGGRCDLDEFANL